MSKGPKKKRRLKRWVYNLILSLVFLLGILVLLYPTFSDWYNKERNKKLIRDYEQQVSSIPEEDYSHILQQAKDYNSQHKINTFIDAFDGEEYILSHPYDTLLNPTGNLIMGSIEVPKINQKLAIGHGTGPAILEQGVGHVEGTSLPVGGPSTHAVLAGHRGLPNAKIFTDLDEIVVGDKFFLYILNETLAYEVDQIVVVEPTEAEELVIHEGQDLVTLLTCTPYGVNSHRMLVRGHRIPFVEEDIIEQSSQQVISERERPIYILVGGIILLFLLVMLMELIRFIKKRKKGGSMQ